MYKQAIRENFKFQTNVGELTAGQLFNASDSTLIQLEGDLKEEVKKAKKPNRFQKSAAKDKTPKLKLSIVSDVIDTIVEEREETANAASKKEQIQELLAEKVRREKEGIKDLSDDALDAKLKELE